MNARRAGLLLLVALVTGCAGPSGVRPDDPSAAVVDDQSRLRPVSMTSLPCPTLETPYRVRDLTVPWTQRRYLLPESGVLCRPFPERPHS